MEQILRVLIIEDDEDDVQLILRELRRANGFEIVHVVVSDEAQIRAALTQKSWDVIICDYFLTRFDAPRVLVMLEHLGVDVPFILVSGLADQELASAAMRIRGVHEFVSKSTLSRIGPVLHRELRLYLGYDEMIRAWIVALEMRDHETYGHSERVVANTMKLCRLMGMSELEIVHIRRGALLHDIGKLGIPDAVLLKQGALTEEETKIMQGHALMGYEMLRKIEVLKRSLDIPLQHHENWDGTGYPYGKAGEDIPLPARIFSVVDAYDAMTSDRPYRPAMSKEKALELIAGERDKKYDRRIVDVFTNMMKEG